LLKKTLGVNKKNWLSYYYMNNAHRISLLLLAFVILCGALVLVGWAGNIAVLKSVIPGFISMKANTAVGLMTLSLASLLLSHQSSSFQKNLGLLLAALIFLLAILTLCEYLFTKDFGIDEFLFLDPDAMKTRWPPGRFAPITGVSFIFISTALICHAINPLRFVKLAQGLVMISWIASLQALVGYICGNSYSFGSAFYTQIALHTALLLISLTTANLLIWRKEGYLRHLSKQDLAGKVGRKLLLAAVVLPPLINVVQVHGTKLQYFDADFGVLIRVMGVIICFACMAMVTGKYLSEIDEKRAIAENAQQVRTEELQRALQARDDLLSICSHELRTPISSMKLQTQFVKYQMEKNDPNALTQTRMLEIIEQSDRQLDRLTKLIEDMLDFSRLNSGRFNLTKEEFDLHNLVVNLLDTFKTQLKANQCELTLSVDAERPILVYWDAHRIEQLIGNLLTNAIKYGSRKPIDMRIYTQPNATCIQIRDQGMGIGPVDVERIFRPYERAISVSKISGLGLGLYISKKIAEAHGGSITVESLAGIGSTFTTVIPNRIIDNLEDNLSYEG
jgi:signal transduction histidine kinase